MSMIQRGKKKSWICWVIIGCIAVVVGLLACALVSYNPHDPSWLCVDSRHYAPTNMCGYYGALCAALLFYLFGGGAFLLLIPLLCCVYIVMNRVLRAEWERLVAAVCLCISVCIWCAMHGIDYAWSPYPGGAIGLLSASMLNSLFDPLCSSVVLYTAIAASCVLLLRDALILFVRYFCVACVLLIIFLKRYQVVERGVHALIMVARILFVRPCVLFIGFIHSLLDGEAFESTDLIIPDDEQHDFAMLVVQKPMVAQVYSDEHAQQVPLCDGPVVTNVMCDVATIDAKDTKLCIDGADVNKSQTYVLPGSDMFTAKKSHGQEHDLEKELEARAAALEDKLKRFGVSGEVVAIKRGPVVTLFEYQPDANTKLSKIITLEDDLAMALSAMSIRIIAPIPGRSVVGFEVANVHRNDVLFLDVIESPVYNNTSFFLPLVLGKGTVGEVVVVDLMRMPHLLIAGATGSGKSVALNGMLISLLCKRNPDELKLILIDPKRLEFAAFADIAHLVFPIVTNPHYAVPVLKWVVQEMERRYETMSQCGAKSIADYNRLTAGEQLPVIVVVIDELADLMLTTGRDIEDLIARITQMARAAGIHMIIATQRPSVDVITGLIKANFPSRISFRVASRIDSRTILDHSGADRLLGRGDMLFLDAATSHVRRVHGAYVSDDDINRVVSHIKSQRAVSYLDMHTMTASNESLMPEDDLLYKNVCAFLGEIDEVSISLLQRRFRIGFNRSARIITMLESQGLIMPTDGSKARKVIR